MPLILGPAGKLLTLFPATKPGDHGQGHVHPGAENRLFHHVAADLAAGALNKLRKCVRHIGAFHNHISYVTLFM